MKTVKQMEMQLKWACFKLKAKSTFNKSVRWLNENKEVVLIAAPVVTGVVGGAFKLAKNLVRSRNLNAEKDLKELYVYDRSLGHYWKLRRPVRNSEWLEINTRKQNGEPLGEILESLRILD